MPRFSIGLLVFLLAVVGGGISSCRSRKSSHGKELLGLLAGAGGSPRANLDPDVPPFTTGGQHTPAITGSWQLQLSGTLNTTYDVQYYDVDLFDTPEATIEALHGGGRRVACYFSAGSAEDWRPDYDMYDPRDLGNPLDGWPGERWVDIRADSVLSVVQHRLDLAAAKGCDGVDPDNMEGYSNGSGFALTEADQKAFNRRVANEAHGRGLFAVLKNDGSQGALLVDYYDVTLNEQCHSYDECALYSVFVAHGKPVWNVEYDASYRSNPGQSSLCSAALAANLRTLVLPLLLDDSLPRVSCDP